MASPMWTVAVLKQLKSFQSFKELSTPNNILIVQNLFTEPIYLNSSLSAPQGDYFYNVIFKSVFFAFESTILAFR